MKILLPVFMISRNVIFRCQHKNIPQIEVILQKQKHQVSKTNRLYAKDSNIKALQHWFLPSAFKCCCEGHLSFVLLYWFPTVAL